jgi:predicted nucleic acid-binding protein
VSVVYDAGALIAADNNDRAMWAAHRVRLEMGVVPRTTAPVVAQVSRSARQAQLRRLLRGCQIEDFTAEQAHQVGALLAQARSSDVVDAHVALTAQTNRSTVLTSDPVDFAALSEHLPSPIRIQTV